MRIAIFSDNFYPELGGIQDSIASLGKEMSKLGHKLIFYVADCSVKDFAVGNLPVKEINLGDNVTIYRCFSLPVPSPTKQSRLVIPTGQRWRQLKKFKPDIIHSHTFFGLGWEAVIAAHYLKLPLIGTNHWVITEFNNYSPVMSNLFSKLSLKYVVKYYNQCDFVTAPSKTVLTEMAAHGFFKPSRVVSNQIDLAVFKPSRAGKRKLKKEFNLSDFTVVYAGRLGNEKNVDVIIKAVALVKKQLPTVNLAIAGHGSAEPRLGALVKKLSLENEVKFLGTLSKEKLARLYNASDVFAIASTSESQSMVLLQAMGCGLPVVGVNWRALPEYINSRNGYLVAPGNPGEMAKKFAYLFKHENKRKLLGRGGLSYVNQFSADNIAKQWEKIYGQVIANYANPA